MKYAKGYIDISEITNPTPETIYGLAKEIDGSVAGPPVDVYTIGRMLGIEIAYRKGRRGRGDASFVDGRPAYRIDLDPYAAKGKGVEYERFVIAHCIGHICISFGGMKKSDVTRTVSFCRGGYDVLGPEGISSDALCTPEDLMRHASWDRNEWLANVFAMKLLAPDALLEEILGPIFDEDASEPDTDTAFRMVDSVSEIALLDRNVAVRRIELFLRERRLNRKE